HGSSRAFDPPLPTAIPAGPDAVYVPWAGHAATAGVLPPRLADAETYVLATLMPPQLLERVQGVLPYRVPAPSQAPGDGAGPGRLPGRAAAPGCGAVAPGARPGRRGSGRRAAGDGRRWHGRRRPARGGCIGAARGGPAETGCTTGWPRRGPVAAAPARGGLN